MDVVVVGGGLGGLAAALKLGAAGREVLVLEAAPDWGGKAATQTVDGVTFDTGPSVFTLPEVAERLFAGSGFDFRAEVTLRPIETVENRFDDVVIPFGEGLKGVLDGVQSSLGGDAADDARSYLSYCENIWNAVSDTFVMGESPGPWSVLRRGPRALQELWAADPMSTMDGAIQRHVRDERLRAIFRRFATYNGSDPRVAPATLNCIAWVELGIGAFGIEGGIHALVEALMRCGRRVGVQYRATSPVASIETDARGVCGVRLENGEQIPASSVVCNADARHLTETLLPGAVRVADTFSTSGWTAVLRTSRRRRPAHEVVFAMPYEDEFRDLFDAERAPVNPTVYVCSQEVAHGRTGWKDEEALFVMTNAPAGCTDIEASRLQALQKLVSTGVVAPSAKPVWERTPAGLATRFPGTRGALYGAASNSKFAAFARPANRMKVPGLYLASGSAHPGGGVPMVLQSGREAARLVLEDRP